MIELIKNKLASVGLTYNPEKVALTYTEGDNYYGISYNYMGTKLHIPKEDVNEELCEENGIKIFKTWTYKK